MIVVLSKLQEDDLSNLLELWHKWQKGDRVAGGFNSKALVVGDCRGWHLQYDGQLDQLDADLDNSLARTVNHEIQQMDDPHRAAIYVEARNLSTGNAVWNSPRLPTNKQERVIIVRYARWQLARRLLAIGVM